MAFRPRHRCGTTSTNQLAKQVGVQSLPNIWVRSHFGHEENNKPGENLKLLQCFFFSISQTKIRQIEDLFQNNTEQIILKSGEYYYKNFNDHLCTKTQRIES